jgi:hypothetical protein
MGEIVIDVGNRLPSLRRLVISPNQPLRARIVRHMSAKTSGAWIGLFNSRGF